MQRAYIKLLLWRSRKVIYKRRNGGPECRVKYIRTAAFGMVLFLILVGAVYLQTRSAVVKAVQMEAGDEEIKIEDFIKDKHGKGDFITDIKSLDTCVVGKHEIKIKVGSRTYKSLLEVIDTKAPDFIVTDQLALPGEELDPNAFVSEIMDATPVKVFFESLPDTSTPGVQEVTLIGEDSGMNRTEKKAKLTVLEVRNAITIEAGSQVKITPEDFVKGGGGSVSFVTDLESLDISKPSVHSVEIKVNEKSIIGSIQVVDTTPPEAAVRAQQVWKEEELSAQAFFDHIEDVSEVSASYKSLPDFNKPGEQNVMLVLTDASGNTAEFSSVLTVLQDDEPPVIQGASDKLVYIGDSVSYRNGISVSDNKDKGLVLEIDSSRVNLKKEGTYKVYYSAADTSGNKTVKETKVKVERFVVSEDTVNELCDKILAKITNSSMTKREIAYEIHKWVKRNLSYTGSSDKSDRLAEAYRGIKGKSGDCFTYFAVAKALLTRAGIDNMDVERVGGKTRHYWSLVNCGEGWYHFDTSPTLYPFDTFMMTDKQTEEYTAQRGNNYYDFDHSLYPATPEE